MRRAGIVLPLIAIGFLSGSLTAQKLPDPEVGYVYPPVVVRGQTTTVQLAGFDWTPDLDFFVLDPRVKLVTGGSLSRHLMPERPYPAGMRAYRPPPIPREITAQITVTADFPHQFIRWQVANANGTSNTGVIAVTDVPDVLESRDDSGPQRLDSLPVTVSGRVERFEEVDEYLIEPTANGLITCELQARRIGSNFLGVLEVHDESGRLVADAADSRSQDVSMVWYGQAGSQYRISLRDLNFRGNRAYVYRLGISTGPRVLACLPAAGQRGKNIPVELIGYGLVTGRHELERLTRTISFPVDADLNAFAWHGEAETSEPVNFLFPLSDTPELVINDANQTLEIRSSAAFTGHLDRSRPVQRFRLFGKQGETWSLAVEARALDSALDVSLAVLDSMGKELVVNDDLPGTTDAGGEFTVPADGIYQIVVSDVSGALASRRNIYRLSVSRPDEDFVLSVSQHVNVPIGDTVELPIKVVRRGGFKEPITLSIAGLPAGISVPAELKIAADQSELKIPLQSAADAPSGGAVVTISGTAQIAGKEVTRLAQAPCGGNLAPQSPQELLAESVLVASTMKPVTRIRPLETDERTAHRGTIHLAELAIERQGRFEGEVVVQMDSRQPAKFRQGIIGPDALVPAGANRVFYPCLVPECAETNDAYRCLLVAVAQVPDPRGRMRYLLSKMQADDASVAITVEGALLKISADSGRFGTVPGQPIQIPVKIARSAKLPAAVRVELCIPTSLVDSIQSEPVIVPAGENEAVLKVFLSATLPQIKNLSMMLRAIAVQPGSPPALSDTTAVSPLDPELIALLKDGKLPVVAEATITLEIAPSNSSDK